MNLVRSISFAISEVLYPLIPKLYDIFILIGSNRFFSEEAILKISNNIYILVSVIILFAFAIKLLNAIINPDSFDDKKKGPARSFINGVIAVVLITVTPIAFEKLYEVQSSVINNNLIEKIVFGMDPEGDYKPGQVLAGYAFSAFCYPNETVGSVNLASEAGGNNYYNIAITQDISKIEEIGENINDKTNDKYDLNYHWILAPIAGGYVCYELVLMCIDIALRSLKLGLLQLIAPLVICAFVFSGEELLTRWIKEIVSTFVLVFVKVAALTFMIYGLALIPDFLSGLDDTVKDSNGDWLMRGFIRVAILVGLLQLVKKLPDLINKIFGTDIKMSGGIGDRLGEMAGIGGLAKGAWDKIKTTSGRVAKKVGIGAAAGIGVAASGPLGWAAAAGAGATAWGWRRGFNNGEPWKDSKAGRGIRTFGAGVRAVGKGLASEGGIIKGIQTGIKDYKDSDVGVVNKSKKRQDIVKDVLKAFNIGDDGRVTDVTEAIHNKDDALATEKARGHWKNVSKNIKTQLRGQHINDTVVDKATEVAETGRDKEAAAAIKGKYESIKEKLDRLESSTSDAKTQDAIRNIRSEFLKGNITGMDVAASIGKILGAPAGGDIAVDAKKLQNLLDLDSLTVRGKFGDILKTDKGGINFGTLRNEVQAMDDKYNTRKSDLDSMEKDYKLKDEQTLVLHQAVEKAGTVGKAVVDTQATTDIEYDVNGNRKKKDVPDGDADKGLIGTAFDPSAPAGSGGSGTGGTPSTSGATGSGSGTGGNMSGATINVNGGSVNVTGGAGSSDGMDSYAEYNDRRVEEPGSGYGPYEDYGISGAPAPEAPTPGMTEYIERNDTRVEEPGSGYGPYEDYRDTMPQQPQQQAPEQQTPFGAGGSGPVEVTVKGPVVADVDFAPVTGKLDEINRSIGTQGTNITNAVNEQGKTLTEELGKQTEHLKTISKGIGDVGEAVEDNTKATKEVGEKVDQDPYE